MVKTRRNKFETCIDIMGSMRGTVGVSPYRIFQRANMNSKLLGLYLKFLEGEELIGSRIPERNEAYCNSEKVYYLNQNGLEFMKELDKYKNKSNLDELRKQLEKVR